jgi:hypothetical protein
MPVVGALDQVRTMKPVLLREAKLRWKVVNPVRRVSIMVAIGTATLLAFVDEINGTTPEPFVVTTGTAASFDLAEAKDPRADRGAIKQSGNDRINDRVTASPGQWLIDDIARARSKYARAHKHKGSQRSIAEGRRRLKSGQTSPDWYPLDVDCSWWYWE